MDIEGGELAALRGGMSVIARDLPSMAIAAYHKANDICDIMKAIKSIDSSYYFYLGHHPTAKYEVELYCVSAEKFRPRAGRT